MEMPLILRELGLSDKEIRIYLTLLTGGPSSVRKLAKETGLNRGTAYEVLKSLQERSLAGMFQKHKKQYFAAEDPERLMDVVSKRETTIASLRRHMADALPELRSLYVHGASKPTVKYYEGAKGVALILDDVLTTVSATEDRLYRAYSSLALREHLYKEYPHFTKERINRRINVHVIAVGPGGDDQPFSERRWLPGKAAAPTYKIVYGGKTAFFSLGRDRMPLGVLVEDEAVAETERMLFDHVWAGLATSRK